MHKLDEPQWINMNKKEERRDNEKGRECVISNSLVHCPSSNRSMSGSNQKPGTPSRSPLSVQGPTYLVHFLLPSQEHQQEVELETEEPGGLTHYPRMPASVFVH